MPRSFSRRSADEPTGFRLNFRKAKGPDLHPALCLRTKALFQSLNFSKLFSGGAAVLRLTSHTITCKFPSNNAIIIQQVLDANSPHCGGHCPHRGTRGCKWLIFRTLSAAQRLGNRLCPGANVKLFVNPPDVSANRFEADPQFVRNLLIHESLT